MQARAVALQISYFSILVLAAYSATAWSMVSIWLRSDTFAHGFLILPIVLWLVWDQRAALGNAAYRQTPLPLLLMIPFGVLWLLANLVDVQVVQQFALVTILVVGIWSIVGHAVAAQMAFPLGFLFLAVPMGEGLVPPMMELTATSTVWLIKLTGIPVYREGLYFALPSGNWSVVAACSGVRYLIASFTLGLLYAYLSYTSLSKRLLFVAASLLVPVLANIVRAYGIVMLGHYSNMQIATGVDHLVYGWLFFGVVMFVLFWLGSFGKEKPLTPHASTAPLEGGQGKGYGVLLLAIVLASLWPVVAQVLERPSAIGSSIPLVAPAAVGSWESVEAGVNDWVPLDPAADHQLIQTYQRGPAIITLYLQQHLQQRQGEELVASGDRFSQSELDSRITSKRKKTVLIDSKTIQIDTVDLSNGRKALHIWGWYRVGTRYTANPYIAKLVEVGEKLRFGRRDSARIYLAIEIREDTDVDLELQDFLTAHLDEIEAILDVAARDAERE